MADIPVDITGIREEIAAAGIRFSTLPACPHCHVLADALVETKAQGFACVRFGSLDGLMKDVETSPEHLTYVRTDYVACANCGRARRDLVYVPASGTRREYVRLAQPGEQPVVPGPVPIDRETGLLRSERNASEYVPSDSRAVLALFDNGASMVLRWRAGREGVGRWIGPVRKIGRVTFWREIEWHQPYDVN